jgi:hypothetical protein
MEFEPAAKKDGKVIGYKRIEPGAEGPNVKEKMVLHQTPRPIMPHWPSMFAFRHNKVAYSNGSAMGYVRKREWLTREGRKNLETEALPNSSKPNIGLKLKI